MEILSSHIGCYTFFAISSLGKGGGLVLLWFKDVFLKIISYSQFHIHMKKSDKIGEHIFFISFYGQPQACKRTKSWSLLSKIN